MKHAALIEVTYEELLERLGLPAGARFTFLLQGPEDILHGRITLLLEDDSLPALPDDAALRKFKLSEIYPR